MRLLGVRLAARGAEAVDVGAGGADAVRPVLVVVVDVSIDLDDPGYQAWLDAIAKDCLCCSNCWERPCGGCQQGAPCDAHRCRCWDESDYEPADDDESWSGDANDGTEGSN